MPFPHCLSSFTTHAGNQPPLFIGHTGKPAFPFLSSHTINSNDVFNALQNYWKARLNSRFDVKHIRDDLNQHGLKDPPVLTLLLSFTLSKKQLDIMGNNSVKPKEAYERPKESRLLILSCQSIVEVN